MYRHRFDPIAFVFGAAFVVIALLVGLPEEPWDFLVNQLALGWLWPVLIIVVGLALLVPALRRQTQPVADEAPEQDVPDEPATALD